MGPNLQNSVPLSILALPMPRTHWIAAVPMEDTPTEITLLVSPFHKPDTILIHSVNSDESNQHYKFSYKPSQPKSNERRGDKHWIHLGLEVWLSRL